jgi:hypothetical protein
VNRCENKTSSLEDMGCRVAFIITITHCRYKAKVEEGLSRLLAFLREEEERERLEEVERLKPIGTPVSVGKEGLQDKEGSKKDFCERF